MDKKCYSVKDLSKIRCGNLIEYQSILDRVKSNILNTKNKNNDTIKNPYKIGDKVYISTKKSPRYSDKNVHEIFENPLKKKKPEKWDINISYEITSALQDEKYNPPVFFYTLKLSDSKITLSDEEKKNMDENSNKIYFHYDLFLIK